jgi:uncharacterized membrane protein YedE/YeeE
MTTTSLSEYDGCGAGSLEQQVPRPAFLAAYLLLGIAFGFVLSRSEVISWFRIQEMFRFQSFRMYGIIGSAVVTAAASLAPIYLCSSRPDWCMCSLRPSTHSWMATAGLDAFSSPSYFVQRMR